VFTGRGVAVCLLVEEVVVFTGIGGGAVCLLVEEVLLVYW
jgi:hypothetical protein